MSDDCVVAGAEQSKVSTDALRVLGLVASRQEDVFLVVQLLLCDHCNKTILSFKIMKSYLPMALTSWSNDFVARCILL